MEQGRIGDLLDIWEIDLNKTAGKQLRTEPEYCLKQLPKKLMCAWRAIQGKICFQIEDNYRSLVVTKWERSLTSILGFFSFYSLIVSSYGTLSGYNSNEH